MQLRERDYSNADQQWAMQVNTRADLTP